MKFKYAILDFKYNNNHFIPLREELERNGTYSVNVGDNMQSIAVRMLYQSIGIQDDEIISINRDDLPYYNGQPAILVMNGCFYEPCFPVPNSIIPIFVGFNAEEDVIVKNKEYFKKYEPIGCRDVYTTQLFGKHNILAYTTGCVTMTFPKRSKEPLVPKIFIVCGRGSGELPEDLISFIPPHIINTSEFIFQRLPLKVYPPGIHETNMAEKYALKLIDRYREEATLIITSLLHAASPCIALGIPVILARRDCGSRFSSISNLLPVYTPDKFSEINWNPKVVNVDNIKLYMLKLLTYLLKEASNKYYPFAALNDCYS